MTKSTGYRVLITGATGFAGAAVLQVGLHDRRIATIRSLSRRPLDLEHPKLTEVIHADFADQSAIASSYEELDAVYYCLGISQSDVPDERRYREITYDFTMETARWLKERSPRAVMHFLSGAGTNVKGRFMWSRIKGQAERDLSAAGLGGAVHYRPALIVGDGSVKSRYTVERLFRPLELLYRPLKGFSIRATEFGQAMVQATIEGIREAVLENRDLRALADRYEPNGEETTIAASPSDSA